MGLKLPFLCSELEGLVPHRCGSPALLSPSALVNYSNDLSPSVRTKESRRDYSPPAPARAQTRLDINELNANLSLPRAVDLRARHLSHICPLGSAHTLAFIPAKLKYKYNSMLLFCHLSTVF